MREFERLAEAGETVGALDAFVRARDLEDRANAAGVLLSGTSAHISEYNGLKRNFVQDLVQQGQQSLDQEDFTGAERTFARALKYSPEDNAIQELWRSAVAEPMHREAHRMYANKSIARPSTPGLTWNRRSENPTRTAANTKILRSSTGW